MRLRSGGQSSQDAAVRELLDTMDYYAAQALEIRQSQIKGGGMGLWTKVDLPANKPIVLYYGELTPRHLGRYCIRVAKTFSLGK